MDVIRMSIVVIVAYVLGLGTGLVGGVVYSFRNFSTPVPVQTAAPSPAPSAVALASPDASPSASPSAQAASPSAAPSAVAVASPGAGAETSPAPSTAPSQSPSASPSESPEASESPRPKPSPSKTVAAEAPTEGEDATLSITANKGKGFKIFIDGNDTNEVTPATLHVPAGPHTIKVVGGNKFRSWQGKITAKGGQAKSIEATLAAIPPPPVAAPPPPPVYQRPVHTAPVHTAPVYRPRSSGGGSGGGGGLPGNRRF